MLTYGIDIFKLRNWLFRFYRRKEKQNLKNIISKQNFKIEFQKNFKNLFKN